MPLSTVCMSTVGSGPRTWSSYSNLTSRDVQHRKMNTEEIVKYKNPVNTYYSPPLPRKAMGFKYSLSEEKPPKKEKKWSFGNFFRRKKKYDSSSDDESRRNSSAKKKGKSDKRKSKSALNFDMVVPNPNQRFISNIVRNFEESSVLSDPTEGYPGKSSGTKLNSPFHENNTGLNRNESGSSIIGSGDDLQRKSRKELTKARAIARRTSMKRNSSSEEESMHSNSSQKFRSDDSMSKRNRDSSLHRRSRTARTERYLKRNSRDGENPNNYLMISKSDADSSSLLRLSDDSNRSPSRSPFTPSQVKVSYSSLSSQSPSVTGTSTIPPSHGGHNKYRVSNSTSNPTYKPPLSMNEYNNTNRKSNNPLSSYENPLNQMRSVSCDANIHETPLFMVQEALQIQLPMAKPNVKQRNLSLIETSQVHNAYSRLHPPPPPPRDPKRVMNVQNDMYQDVNNLDGPVEIRHKANMPNGWQVRKYSSPNLNPTFRSTSEDHIPKDRYVNLIQRPSSATPEYNNINRIHMDRANIKAHSDNIQYLTDKQPRSRKPISIQQSLNNLNDNRYKLEKTRDRSRINLWKEEVLNADPFFEKLRAKERTCTSPQMFTAQTRVQTQLFLPSVLQDNNANDEVAEKDVDIAKIQPVTNSPSQTNIRNDVENDNITFRCQPIVVQGSAEVKNDSDVLRTSSNLDEALDELEAIYNSLKLGDDKLLERAETREKKIAAAKNLSGVTNLEVTSDASFSYEPYDTLDSPKRQSVLQKSPPRGKKVKNIDYKKSSKNRAYTISDPQNIRLDNEYSTNEEIENEPDIELDDVVYRNLKHANNLYKVPERQPPFGIPIGPITLAANSDYLHVVPDNTTELIRKPTNLPDIVKDDLAYRSLRKDNAKEPALPPVSPDDFKNNNSQAFINQVKEKPDLSMLKKKRAVRSVSANIGSLISQDVIEKAQQRNRDNQNENNTLTDIADAMEIARQVLREKDLKITETKRASMSDTDANQVKYVRYPSSKLSNCDARSNFFNSLNVSKYESNNTKSSLEKRKSSNCGDNSIQAKPPRATPDSKISKSPTKESTPVPVFAFDSQSYFKTRSRTSSFEDILVALAMDATENSDRITKELKKLGEDKDKRKSIKDIEETAKILIDIGNEENSSKNANEENTDMNENINMYSKRLELCEQLLKSVVDSNEHVVSTKGEVEEVAHIDEDPPLIESVANIIFTKTDNKVDNPQQTKTERPDSDHDYENLVSDKELNLDEVSFVQDTENVPKSKSPFETHKFELVAHFKNLNVSQDEKNADVTTELTNQTAENVQSRTSESIDGRVTGEAFVDVVTSASVLQANTECAHTHFDLDSRDSEISSRNSWFDSRTSSSGFYSHRSSSSQSETSETNNLDSLESLKSPKLVLRTSKLNLFDSERNCGSEGSPGCSKVPDDNNFATFNSSREAFRWRGYGGNCSNFRRDDGHIPDVEKSPGAWHCNPVTVAVACSYGVACVHQLASLDLFAILSIVLAVITFIAAMFM